MKTVNCPQCGAGVAFRAEESVVAVCGFCTSTLVRHGEALENIGRMAELQDDPTRIQLGTEGVYNGVHFAVIGRIQLKYPEGLWNEWYLMFDNMRTAWLGEAQGQFTVTFENPDLKAPSIDAVNVDAHVQIGRDNYLVTNFEAATCIAGQGELPFKVGPGYEAPVADLRLPGDESGKFISLDYSDDPPRVYEGQEVKAKSLRLSNLRDLDAPVAASASGSGVKAFNCPACAAPFSLKNPDSKTWGCPSCGSQIDTSDATVKLLSKAKEALSLPRAIPLGAKAKFENLEFEVIGHMRRASSEGFSWSEYLMFHAASTEYRWLIEADNHWTVAEATKPLKQVGDALYDKGKSYAHFQTYSSEVTHVLGEFNWRVKAGDTTKVDDYISPPIIISREKAVREVSTTRGTYYTPDEIVKAFGLKTALAAPVGVAPHQPSPYEGLTRAIWKRFGLFTLIALGLQLMFALFTTKVHEEIFSVDPGRESAVTSKPFKIDGSGALNLVTYTDLDNTWAGIGFELVDPKSGKVWKQASEMGFYSGIDEDGDRWSEGSARDYVVFTGVPAGEYLLSIEAELPKDAKRALHGRVVVERGHASWLNWILIQIVLLLMPLFAWWRSNAFETERWMNSDHPRGGGDDDDD